MLRVKAKKGAPGVSMCINFQNPPMGTSISITLSFVRQLIFLEWKMLSTEHPLCGQQQRSDGRTQLFTCKNHPHICPFQLKTSATTCNDIIFSLKFAIASSETMQTVNVKAVSFLTSNPPKYASQAAEPCCVAF